MMVFVPSSPALHRKYCYQTGINLLHHYVVSNHPMFNSQIVLVRMDGPKNLKPGEVPSVNMTRWWRTGRKHG